MQQLFCPMPGAEYYDETIQVKISWRLGSSGGGVPNIVPMLNSIIGHLLIKERVHDI